jgi:hypothetical protein
MAKLDKLTPEQIQEILRNLTEREAKSASEVNTIISEAREPRRIQSNTDFIRTEDIREFLLRNGLDTMQRWWDGTYFEHHLWFLFAETASPGFEIMVENYDGTQMTTYFDVVLSPKEIENEKGPVVSTTPVDTDASGESR